MLPRPVTTAICLAVVSAFLPATTAGSGVTEAEFAGSTIRCSSPVPPYSTNHCVAWLSGTATIASCDGDSCELILMPEGRGEGWASVAPRFALTTSVGPVCDGAGDPALSGVAQCAARVVLTVPAPVGERTDLRITGTFTEAPAGVAVFRAIADAGVTFVNDGDGTGYFPRGGGPTPQ